MKTIDDNYVSFIEKVLALLIHGDVKLISIGVEVGLEKCNYDGIVVDYTDTGKRKVIIEFMDGNNLLNL